MSELSNFIEQLKTRITLSSVISKYISIQKKGREFQCCCPFHNEKTPSFTINDDKGFYHCFGCGEHGDAISFLEKYKGYEFLVAVEELSDSVGMKIPKNKYDDKNIEEKSLVNKIYEAMESACSFFQQSLKSPVGEFSISYMKRREINNDSIRKFRIGYAPNSGLYEFLKNDFSEEVLIKSNLIVKREGDGRIYDRFRNRLMFPIEDRRNRVIAFGGRALEKGQEPKYLNSSETPIFHKKQTLYALNKCDIKKDILVMEGYTDVIAAHQYGINQAVASLGTAFGEDHIDMLWKICKSPILCFDGDNAGKIAANRVMERAMPKLNDDFSLRFCLLPSGEDPDTIIKKDIDKFKSYISNPKSLEESLWSYLYSSHSMESPGDKRALLSSINKWSEKIEDKILQGFFKDYLRKKFTSKKKEIDNLFWENNRYKSKYQGIIKDNYEKKFKIEKILLAIILNHPILMERISEEVFKMDNLSNELESIKNSIISLIDMDDFSINSVNKIVSDNPNLDDSFFKNSLLYEMIPESLPSADIEDVEKVWQCLWNDYDVSKSIKKALMECNAQGEMDDEKWNKMKQLKISQNKSYKKGE